MEFCERRPIFRAVQFDGTTASVEKMDECGDIAGYTIAKGLLTEASVIIRATSSATTQVVTIKKHDWLVAGPDGRLSTMTDLQMRERFERFEPQNNPWIIKFGANA